MKSLLLKDNHAFIKTYDVIIFQAAPDHADFQLTTTHCHMIMPSIIPTTYSPSQLKFQSSWAFVVTSERSMRI